MKFTPWVNLLAGAPSGEKCGSTMVFVRRLGEAVCARRRRLQGCQARALGTRV